MYVTLAQLADAKLTRELAQVTSPDNAPVIEDALMEATLRGTDRSAWAADLIALADAASVTITQAASQASEIIDGYLRNRRPVPYVVPLDPVPGIVAVWARWIARYLLLKDRVNTTEATDPVVRDYKEACRFLDLTATSKFSLGASDPSPPATGTGGPQVSAPARVFTGDTLADFGT